MKIWDLARTEEESLLRIKSAWRDLYRQIEKKNYSRGTNFGCGDANTLQYLTSTVTKPRRRIRAHYEQMSEFERGRSIGLKETDWLDEIEEFLNIWAEMMQRLDVAGKTSLTTADFSVRTAAVDRGPQQRDC
ncbi:hypothetical protein TNCV_3904051 [Trichonephila clavipes]|nr:hypothetical protein TNCV_3904051 [Trichonephila clavipes]